VLVTNIVVFLFMLSLRVNGRSKVVRSIQRFITSTRVSGSDWARWRTWRTFSGAHLSGFIAWLVWVFIHLMCLVTFQSRVLVFIQWAIQTLTFSRGARLITGAAPTDFNFSKELSEIKPEAVNAPR
jgi:ABC-type Fe3+ transport system permease subunit